MPSAAVAVLDDALKIGERHLNFLNLQLLKWFSSFSRALVYGDFQKVAQVAWHEDRALEAQKIVEILGEEKQILVRVFMADFARSSSWF